MLAAKAPSPPQPGLRRAIRFHHGARRRPPVSSAGRRRVGGRRRIARRIARQHGRSALSVAAKRAGERRGRPILSVGARQRRPRRWDAHRPSCSRKVAALLRCSHRRLPCSSLRCRNSCAAASSCGRSTPSSRSAISRRARALPRDERRSSGFSDVVVKAGTSPCTRTKRRRARRRSLFNEAGVRTRPSGGVGGGAGEGRAAAVGD